VTDAAGNVDVDVANVTVEHPLPDGVPGVSSTPPRDLDGDGVYEDVDGDGTFDFLDVVAFLFADWTAIDALPEERAGLDHSGDGTVDLVDVVELLFALP